MLSSLLTAKLAIAVAAAAVPVGAVTVAAAVTASPSQASAHAAVDVPPSHAVAHVSSADPTTTSGTPTTDTSTASTDPTEAATPTATPTESPSGPDATGPAAFGLCNAWTHGGLGPNSVALKNLATAAGGQDGIGAYCAGVAHPGDGGTEPSETESPDTESPDTQSPDTTPTQHGRPSDVPRGGDSGHSEGNPTTHD